MTDWDNAISEFLLSELQRHHVPRTYLTITETRLGQHWSLDGGENRCGVDIETIEDVEVAVEFRALTSWNKEYPTQSERQRNDFLRLLGEWINCVATGAVVERFWTAGSLRIFSELRLCDEVVLVGGIAFARKLGRHQEESFLPYGQTQDPEHPG